MQANVKVSSSSTSTTTSSTATSSPSRLIVDRGYRAAARTAEPLPVRLQ